MANYLSTTAGKAIESTGKVDVAVAIILALLAAVAGAGWVPLTDSDVANAVIWGGLFVGAWLIVELLVLTPASEWRKDQAALEQARHALAESQSPSVVNNTTNVYAFVYPVADPSDTKTASGGTTVSPEEPQSPESSKHD